MQKLLLTLCFMSIFAFSFAIDGSEEKAKAIFSLEILVIDAKTEEPIPAAEVSINQKKYSGFTDFDGLVQFSNLTEGNYDIEVTFVSYQKRTLKSQKLDLKNHQLIVKL